MDNYERELLTQALELLHRIIGHADAKEDVARLQRPLYRVVYTSEKVATALQNEKSDLGKSDDVAEQGFVEFTEQEIKQMPKQLQRIIIVNRKRCRIRKHVSGKNSTTYEIRFRSDGYEISACGKTKELAKANMLDKLKNAKPKERENAISYVFGEFALYYFEKFRKPKVAELTYKNDLARLKLHILPTFEGKPIKKITPSDCEALLNRIKAEGKGKTADEIYSLLSVIFKAAIAHGIIERNPIAIVPHEQHVHQHGKALSSEEIDLLFERIKGTQFEVVLALALYTGLRPNELKSATVQKDFVVAINSKRHKKEIVYKRIPICKRLAGFLKTVEFDLTNLSLKSEKYYSMKFPQLCPGHKLYDLRTTFYSKCKELGVAKPALKEFMGHSSGDPLEEAYSKLSDAYLLKEGKKLNKW